MPELEPTKVLVCDDDQLFRESTAMLLRQAGFQCDAVATLDSARERLSHCRRAYDVVLIDLILEEEAGGQLVTELAGADSPAVIIVTGHPSLESAISAVDDAAAGYLVKPVSLERLTDRIRSAAAQRTRRAWNVPPCDCGEHADEQPRAIDPELLQWLTPREKEIVDELSNGYRVSSIANHLGISTNTVRRHLKSIFLKLEVGSQAELLEKLKPRL